MNTYLVSDNYGNIYTVVAESYVAAVKYLREVLG